MTMTTQNTSSAPKSIVNWFEIPVTNMEKARSLYEAMLDLKIPVSDFGGVPHAVLSNSDASCTSGALISDPARPPTRGSGTVLYLHATDGVARCLSRAVEAGAKVVQPRTEIGPHGAIALLEDLDGNVIGLHEHPAA
jgi:predicted enzyme related to lactoylglutathione lyase